MGKPQDLHRRVGPQPRRLRNQDSDPRGRASAYDHSVMPTPLEVLRSDWRAAAEAASGNGQAMARYLDRALALLAERRQLDSASLLMAGHLVCDASTAPATDVGEVRARLRQAVLRYEALAADQGDHPPQRIGVALDRESLRIALLEPRGHRRLLGALAGGLAFVAILVAGVLVTRHGGDGERPAQPVSTADVRTATFASGHATCQDGAAQPDGNACRWGMSLTAAGAVRLAVTWDTDTILRIVVIDGHDQNAAPPVIGRRQALVAIPHLEAGTYTIEISNPSQAAGPIHVAVRGA